MTNGGGDGPEGKLDWSQTYVGRTTDRFGKDQKAGGSVNVKGPLTNVGQSSGVVETSPIGGKTEDVLETQRRFRQAGREKPERERVGD